MHIYTFIMHEHTKKERQQLLRELVAHHEIGDQAHLLEELKRKGLLATQATLSRDLQEMGVVKVRTKTGGFRYEIIEPVPANLIREKVRVLFDNFVLDVRRTGKLLLVKTTPGNANGVASFIDRLGLPEVLGTVAGDDTILVVAKSARTGKAVEEEFRSLLGGREGVPGGGPLSVQATPAKPD